MGLVDTIVAKVNIVDYISNFTELHTQNYREWRGVCPVHQGSTATSMSVKPPLWICHSCGAGGTVINFVMEMFHIEFFAAVEKLADEYNIPMDKQYEDMRSVIRTNEANLARAVGARDRVYNYLRSRGLSPETIDKFEYGFNNERLIIPIRDENGRLVAFARRSLDGSDPKYINDRNSEIYEKASTLYNFHNARRRMKDCLYIAEGYMDVASADQEGLAAVAYCGSEITKEQIMQIARCVKDYTNFTIILAPDNDDAGQKKIPRMREKFKQYAPQFNVHILKFTADTKDFNDCLKAGISITQLDTENIDLYCLKMKLQEIKKRDQQYVFAQEYTKTVKNKMIVNDIAKYLSELWGTDDAKAIYEMLNAESVDMTMRDEFVTAEEAVIRYKQLIGRGKVQTGFASLDESINNIRKSEVTYLIAYSGVAKTFVACQWALYMAVKAGLNVIFFSLEMSAESLYERIIAMFLGISTRELQERVANDDPVTAKVMEAVMGRLYVVDTPALDIKGIESRIMFANQHVFGSPTDVIFVDYIQNMKGCTEYDQLAPTAQGFKDLSKKHRIASIVLSQLNRTGNQWTVPTMNQIRGAGDIEASADFIFGFAQPGRNPNLDFTQKKDLEGIIQAEVLKARRGCDTFNFKYKLERSTTRITEVS